MSQLEMTGAPVTLAALVPLILSSDGVGKRDPVRFPIRQIYHVQAADAEE